jgi:hypothetical protein
MNPTRTLVSTLTSFVRSACVAVFTHPSTATHASNSQAAPAAPPPPLPKRGQSVLVRIAPSCPALTAARRRGRPPGRGALSARGAAKLRRLLPVLTTADTSGPSLGTGFTKLDTIRALERSIAKTRRRGYTLAEIAQALTDNGLPITRATLGVYLRRISKPTPSTQTPLIPDSFVASTDVESSERHPFIPASFFASTDVESFERRPAFPPFPLPL